MQKSRKLLQAPSCLLCLVVMWKWGFVFVFAGPEAEGGALTGPLENLYDISFLLFAVALVLVFLFPRVSAWITVGACLLSFPLDLYFITPNLFRRVFMRMVCEGPAPNFIWNGKAIVGSLALTPAVSIALWDIVNYRTLNVAKPLY